MISAYTDDAILLGGIIQNVRFSKEKDRAYVEMQGKKMTLEFRNAKKNRADLIRRMRFQEGEPVIAIGAESHSSEIYSFGWEMQREGALSYGYYSLLKGTVNQVFLARSSVLILKVGETKTYTITVSGPDISHISRGDEITCLCYRKENRDCMKQCPDRTMKKCSNCTEKKREQNLYMLKVERNR